MLVDLRLAGAAAAIRRFLRLAPRILEALGPASVAVLVQPGVALDADRDRLVHFKGGVVMVRVWWRPRRRSVPVIHEGVHVAETWVPSWGASVRMALESARRG